MSLSRLALVLVPSLLAAAGCADDEPRTDGAVVQFLASCEQEIIDACDAAGTCDPADLDGLCDADPANDCASYVHIKCALSGLDAAACDAIEAQVCAPLPVPPDAADCAAAIQAGCDARGIPADACAGIIDATCNGGAGGVITPGGGGVPPTPTDAACAAAYDACIAGGGTPADCDAKVAALGC